MLHALKSFFNQARRRPFCVFHHPAYRFPIGGAESSLGLETRRADDALGYLLHQGVLSEEQVLTPEPISYLQLGRVHSADYLESLTQPETLAGIYAVEPQEVSVDGLMKAVRLACGGTVAAAVRALETGEPALNLVGGFHHAAPNRGAGFCPVNDVAVAIAELRAQGLTQRVAIIDLDAHPPDGTAACIGSNPLVWHASLSGSDWGVLPGVDETVLPPGCGDAQYLDALKALLGRMPHDCGICFVLAGGDVLKGDKLGVLGLTLEGVRTRDLLVLEHLGSMPSVWLSAGGYGPSAWKVLAGTGLVLGLKSDEQIDRAWDPLSSRFARVARGLDPGQLGSEPLLTEADVADLFGGAPTGPRKLLGYYTAEGLDYALEQLGVLAHLRRLGFEELRVEIEDAGTADRARLKGRDVNTGVQSTLVELEVERRAMAGGSFLFVNWVTLKNPRAQFSHHRPQLPGQEQPGLGLAREMTEIIVLMAKRLILDGVAFRPSWFHMAWAARHGARFADPARQGRFEALVRDLKPLPLLEATHAVADGRVQLNGAPWVWEPEDMVRWLKPHDDPDDARKVNEAREACHFTVLPR